MKCEQLESRYLKCAAIDPLDWIVFEAIGDWQRDVTLGVSEVYELKADNSHSTCSFKAEAVAFNLFGGISTYEEASFDYFENAAIPENYDGTLDPGEEVTFVMRSTPKFTDQATPDNPGRAIAEVLVAYGDNGGFLDFDSIVAPIKVKIADVDLDGEVGFRDFLVLSANFGKQVDSYFAGDFDLSGTVDFADFLILAGHFGKVGPGEGH